jgi:hypothetical protein
MRRLHAIYSLTFAILIAELCSPARASDQALMIIANVDTGVTSLSRNELESIFMLSRRIWSNGKRILVVNLENGTPERTLMDRALLNMSSEQAARYWIDRRTRGGGEAPMRVPSAALMMKVIPALTGSIGYAPAGPLVPGMVRVARIVNGGVVPEH